MYVCSIRMVFLDWYGRLMICPQLGHNAMESYMFACGIGGLGAERTPLDDMSSTR